MAKESYDQAMKAVQQISDIDTEQRKRWEATTYHELGIVAQEQRQWAQAEAYYQQALALKVEFNDRYSQASTYAQLGLLAEEIGNTRQVLSYLLQALERFAEAGDRFNVENVTDILSRVRRVSGDATLPAAVAAILHITPAEAENLLAAAAPAEG